MEKKTIYMVEVGVELENKNDEYEAYKILLTDLDDKKVYKGLYDENVLAFLDYHSAVEFINEYVEKGVENTYGFMWVIERDIEDWEIEELVGNLYLEDELYSGVENKISYFKGGIKDESVK